MTVKSLFFLVALCGCIATPQSSDIGYQYLGTKYIINPLGENAPPDTDPLIRTDAFDCTTFVETTLANGDLDTLTKIRYNGGIVDFTTRNHFIESDWIPNNSNYIENVSAKYGVTAYRHVVIDKQAWFKTVYQIDTDFSQQSIDLEYIPYHTLTQISNKKPLIVLFVVGNCEKYDKIGTDIAIVHMGFLLPGGKILRHASSATGAVVDTDFETYIQTRKNMKNNIGISLLGIK